MGNRVPKEPVPESSDTTTGGFSVPASLDFNTLDISNEEAIEAHMRELIDAALHLTDIEIKDDGMFKHVKSKTIKVPTKFTQRRTIAIRAEVIAIAGSKRRSIKGVRHTMQVSRVSPKYILDAYNRLNYTSAIDKFTYLVEKAAPIDVPPALKDSVPWCHVAYTADTLAKPLKATRDFVTFDFINEDHLLLTSRSCRHESRPETAFPRRFRRRHNSEKTIRVPLLYYLRIVPDKHDSEKCTIVQFQYSDVGGFVPAKVQTSAVVDFGFDSLPKLLGSILDCKEQGIVLGPGTDGYLKNPLEPTWRQDPADMIPGI